MPLTSPQESFLRTMLILANRTIIARLSNPNSAELAIQRTRRVFKTKENFCNNFKSLVPSKWGDLKSTGVFLSDYIRDASMAEEYVQVLREIFTPDSGYIASYGASPQYAGHYRIFFQVADVNAANQWMENSSEYSGESYAAEQDQGMREKLEDVRSTPYGGARQPILSNGNVTLFRVQNFMMPPLGLKSSELEQLVDESLKVCLFDRRETAILKEGIVKATNNDNCFKLVHQALQQNKYNDIASYFKQYKVPVTSRWFRKEQGPIPFSTEKCSILVYAAEKLDQNLIRIAAELYKNKNNDYEVNPEAAQHDQQAAIAVLISRIHECKTIDQVHNLVRMGELLVDNFHSRPDVSQKVASFLTKHLHQDAQLGGLRPATMEMSGALPAATPNVQAAAQPASPATGSYARTINPPPSLSGYIP